MIGTGVNWDWISWSIIIAFNAFYLFLMFYYLKGWLSLKSITSAKALSTRVSVVIACRNEADNVAQCIESLVAQDYSKDLLECIIVNDHSADNTAAIISEYASNYPFVQLLDLEGGTGKRSALTAGISIAKGDFIMTTDGDCWVAPTWVSEIIKTYESTKAKMVLGPVAFAKGRSLLTLFQELDFIGMIGIAGGSTAMKYPHVCNGANLSYEKTAFKAINGFEGEDKNPSGDDMILLQKMNAKFKGEIHFAKSDKAMTYTDPMYNWKDFINQRIRWASKGGEMLDKKITMILGSVLVYNLVPLVLLVSLALGYDTLNLLLFHIAIKFGMDYLLLSNVLHFYQRKALLIFYPFAQVLHIAYIVVVGTVSQFSSFDWKGRKIQA